MLSPSAWQKNTKNAANYFRDHFSQGVYYREGGKATALLLGNLPKELGLEGQELTQAFFVALAEGRHPLTGERLGPREKDDRRCDKDWTWSAPKSVSILAQSGDQEIRVTLRAAVNRGFIKGMLRAEKEAACRDRGPGAKPNASRHTGNIAAAIFLGHDTARPTPGNFPDPDLHCHGLVFNLTRDPKTGCILALDDAAMLRARKIIESTIEAEVAAAVVTLGFKVELDGKYWRVAEVDRKAETIFSKRKHQIAAQADAKADEIERKSGKRPSAAEVRQIIAHQSREKKMPHLAPEDLRADWRRQLREAGIREDGLATDPAKNRAHAQSSTKITRKAMDQAISHLIEREAVVAEQALIVSATRFSLGSGLSPDDMRAEVERRVKNKELLRSGDKLTTAAALQDEQRLVKSAKAGRGRVRPIVACGYQPAPNLSAEQAEAARVILTSRDRISILRGPAGTGKSTLLAEIVAQAERAGNEVLVVAPTGRQTRELQADGFSEARTLARLLTRPIPKGATVILDEAGQTGIGDLLRLQAAVETAHGRLLLSGDSRQHGSVARGDALRQLESEGGVARAELRTVYRQDSSRARDDGERQYIEVYRAAVGLAAQGKAQDSFDRMNELGSVQEVADPLAEAAKLAQEKGRDGSVLVVTQTRSAVALLNEMIRGQRVAAGQVAASGKKVTVYSPNDMTEAERRDMASYKPGALIALNQKHGEMSRGSVAVVAQVDADRAQLVVRSADGKVRRVGLANAKKWRFVESSEIEISTGDKLLLRQNAQLGVGRSVANGEVVEVQAITEDGAITLSDGRILPASYRHFAHGYASTSFSGQGRTVEHVIVADSANRVATSSRQWYVDLSRGRRSATILTASKSAMRAAVDRTGDSSLATDFTWERPPGAREKLAALANKLSRPVVDLAQDALRRVGLSRIEAEAQSQARPLKAKSRSHQHSQVQAALPARNNLPELPDLRQKTRTISDTDEPKPNSAETRC